MPAPSSKSELVPAQTWRWIPNRNLLLHPSTHPDPIPTPISPLVGALFVTESALKEGNITRPGGGLEQVAEPLRVLSSPSL